jgi:hypothetical protein
MSRRSPALIVVFTFIIVPFSFLPSSTTLQIPNTGIIAHSATRGSNIFPAYGCSQSPMQPQDKNWF